ncbi:MAG: peptidoglycan DD-metalloendopeptidase family protein, partial [Cyanobacteria bacterium P01_A01_bin.37]
MGVNQWLLNYQEKFIFGAAKIGLTVGLIGATVSSTAIAADDVQATNHKQEHSELASTSGSDSGQVDASMLLEPNGHQHRAESSEEYPSNSPDLTHQSYRFGVPGVDYTFSAQTPDEEMLSSVSQLFSQDNDVALEQVEVIVKPLELLESISASTIEQSNNDNAGQVETVEIEPDIMPDRIVSSEPKLTEIEPGTGQIEAEQSFTQSSPTVSPEVGAVEPEVSYSIPVETEADPVESSEPNIIILPAPRQTVPTNTGVVAHQEPRIEREPISPGSGYIQLSNGVFVPREFAQVDSLISQHKAIAQVIGTPSRNRLLAIAQMQSFRGQGREISAHAPLSFAQQYSAALISDTAIVNGAVYNQDQFPVYPLLTHGQLSSEFGWREQFGRHHDGYDIAVPIGTLVRASFSGRVKFADFNGNYGRLIQIEHNGNLETRYAHLSRIFVRPGQYVAQGTIIGATGNTGNTTGPHLHYEIRQNGAALNINDIVPEQRNLFLASVQRIRSKPLRN